MNVKLIRHTLCADELAGQAAAKCTRAKDINKARDHAMEAGHESIAEHAVFTFEVDGVSRVLLAQLTRHRMASYSVESQRYVDQSDGICIVPPSIKANAVTKFDLMKTYEACFYAYQLLIESGVPEEDARYVLPQGIATNLILTMNARELRHFFSLRMCNRAQWEIRELADRMYMLCYRVAPALFDDAGPGCVNHGCPEGKRCCGHPRIQDISTLKKIANG